MSTSIKIREEDKRRLDRLQGEFVARRGQRLSQQALVTKLLDLGEEQKERLLADAARPATAKELRRLFALPVDTGVPSREEDIDRDIVGEIR